MRSWRERLSKRSADTRDDGACGRCRHGARLGVRIVLFEHRGVYRLQQQRLIGDRRQIKLRRAGC